MKAGSVSLGIRPLTSELGIQFDNPDACAAIGTTDRFGSGKIRHVELAQLWLYEKVRTKVIIVNKVDTDHNSADALSKGSGYSGT